MKTIPLGAVCGLLLAFASSAKAQTLIYTFTGHLTSVQQSGGGAGASSFGTIPVGSEVTARLIFHDQQTYAPSRTYYYTGLEIRIGSEVFIGGPFDNYAGGVPPIENPAAQFTLSDGLTSDSLALSNTLSGSLGGLTISSSRYDPVSLNAAFAPSAISSTDRYGLDMDPSDFISGTMYIPQNGYGLANFLYNMPGYYRMGITFDSFTAVPEPAAAATLILSVAGCCVFPRRRR